MPEIPGTIPPENPYAAPLAPIESGSDSALEPQVEELRAFVGPKADYYLDKWYRSLQGRGRDAGFNWAAFLFSGLWLPYRKMYTSAFLLYGFTFFAAIVEQVVFVVILGRPEIPPGIDRLPDLAAGAICGMYGNRWYLSHARRVIAAARAEGLQDEALVQALSRRGGKSLGSALGMFLLFLLIAGALFSVIDLVQEGQAG